MLLGLLLITGATVVAIWLGWLGNRGVRNFDESKHVSFVDLSVAGKQRSGKG